MTRSTATKVMAALITLQLLVAAVAAATVDDTTVAPLGGGGTTTTTFPGEVPLPGDSPAAIVPGDGQIAPPGSSDTTGPTGSSGTNSPGSPDLRALPERPTPPQAGSYAYRDKFDGNAAFGSFTTQVKGEEETTTKFEALEADAAGARDRQRQDGSSTSGGFTASGSASEERSWRSDGMYVTREAASVDDGNGDGEGGGGFNGTCQWQPPLRRLAFPLRIGATWSWDSRCETKSEDGEFRRRSQGSAKVTGKRTVTVAGKEVAVLVIEVRSTDDVFISREDEGRQFDVTTHAESEGLDLYASSVALVVRGERKIKGTSQSSQAPGQTARFEGDSLRELLSLDPR